MITYSKEQMEEYLKDDWILELIKNNMTDEEKQIRTNKWLLEMSNKRMVYAGVYGDILREKSERKVLDVGGGYHAITKVLSQNCDYHLLDFLAHGGNEYLVEVSEKYGIHWVEDDWYNQDVKDYDIIIANDIFPDVDQRLELFIDRMLPHCKELRLVITYYNEPKFYTTKRNDDSEIMTFLSWDGEITGLKLKKYLSRMDASNTELDDLKNNHTSIYWNNRQVSYVVLKGDL